MRTLKHKHWPMAVAVSLFAFAPASPVSAASGLDPGIGNVPQGVQSDSAYAASYKNRGVTNVFVTSQQVSCYRPEVPIPFNNGPNDGYTGELACPGATTGEDIGSTIYATQVGSRAPYPAATPMLVTDHSESDIRVDPTNPNHIIGSSKWFTGAEGYNHLLGFYESWDGGKTWPVMGHIPGYEGWTDNTDPVGAFDPYGNYYEAILPYQFYYDKSGFKKYETGNEPNPAVDNEAVSIAVRPHGATGVRDWITTHHGKPDHVFTTNAGLGQEPDKQWIAIDRTGTKATNPNYGRIYVTYVNFNGNGSKPYVRTAIANEDGTHSDWTAPVLLPTAAGATNNNTYLYPHVDPHGVVFTPVVNYASSHGSCCVDIYVDYSTDGGTSWIGPLLAVSGVHTAPLSGAGYANTTFEDGIEETFAVGDGAIYLGYESKSSGFGNLLLTASYDRGQTWTAPVQVNDNASPTVDEFQPNLAVGPDGTVSVNFYDRRLACPVGGTKEALNAGLALDQMNPSYSGSLPPYGATNYCVTSSVQFYSPDLTPKGHNIRLTQHSWDPQLNSPDRQCPCNPTDTFLGDYFGNEIAGSFDYATFVSTYDDGTNPQHYQQQVVARISVP